MPNTITLREIAQADGPLRVDREAGVIYGVKVLGLESANRRTYLPDAVRKAIPLYEGRAVNADHPSRKEPDQSRSIRDRVGWLRNVREQSGLVGDLHLLKTNPLSATIFEVAERNPASFGLSHNAEGRVKRTPNGVLVEEITEVRSVDVVGDPATTRSLFEETNMADATATSSPAEAAHAAFRDAMLAIIDGDGDVNAKKKAIGDLLKQDAKTADTLSQDQSTSSSDGDASAADADAAKTAESVDALKAKVAKLEAREHARELLEAAGLKQSPEWVDAVALLENDDKRQKFIATLPRQPARARSGAPLNESKVEKLPEIKDGKSFAAFITEGR